MTRHLKAVLLHAALVAMCFPAGCWAATSELWGQGGEKWSPTSRLPDFSFAGYHSGEKPLPNVPARTNVRDFGAAGDGVHDDTDAFRKAIAATNDGALLIPSGQYVLSDVLELRRSRVVLRGQDRQKTVLRFTRGLDAARPRNTKGAGGEAPWSWEGAMIWATGDDTGLPLTDVIAPAKRGDRTLKVSSTAGLKPGQFVLLCLTDSKKTLRACLHEGQYAPDELKQRSENRMLVRFPSRIESVGDGAITIERPIRSDVELRWSPAIYSATPTVEEIGIENLTIEMPATQYVRHWKETGNNAIQFERVWNSWVRDVTIRNADSGVFLEFTNFCAVQNVALEADPARLNRFKTQGVEAAFAGHHGVQARGGGDNVISEVDLKVQFVHDFTVEATSGNVFCDSRGVDMNLDHHTDRPYENLFTNLDLGAGTRAFASSGSLGPASAARETFWNIRSGKPVSPPTFEGKPWPMANLVGVNTANVDSDPLAKVWIESIGEYVVPTNLYWAQLERRLKDRKADAR